MEDKTQTQVTKMFVSGMTCDHCANAVTEELKELDNVIDVKIEEVVKDGDTEVFVETEGVLDIRAAEAAVAEAGYEGRV